MRRASIEARPWGGLAAAATGGLAAAAVVAGGLAAAAAAGGLAHAARGGPARGPRIVVVVVLHVDLRAIDVVEAAPDAMDGRADVAEELRELLVNLEQQVISRDKSLKRKRGKRYASCQHYIRICMYIYR